MAKKPFNVREIMVDLNTSVSDDMRKTGLRVLTAEVFATPVKTGHARANWHPTIGTPNNGELDAEDRAGGATIAAGARVLARYPKEGKLPPIYVQNAVPYIEALNNGHSKQAPAGFVEKAVQAAVSLGHDRVEL